jgi:hypothetical protein
MIYKDVVNVIKDALSRFKGVNFVKYQGDDLNNHQHNYNTIQCYIDDISLHQFNLTTNIVKAQYEIYILGFPENTPDSILDIQDKCYNVAINVLAWIDTRDELKGIVRVYDYSILTLSRYTDQSNAGVKLSLILEIPNGVDMCTMEDNFGEPYTPEPDNEIDLDTDEVGDIDLRPINLPRSGC